MEEEGKEDSDDVDTVVDSAGNFRRCPPNVYGEFTCDESSISAIFVGIDVEEYYDELYLHEKALFDARVFTAGKGRESGHFDFDSYVVVPVIDGSVYAIDITTGDIDRQALAHRCFSPHQNDVDPSSMGSTNDSQSKQSGESDGNKYIYISLCLCHRWMGLGIRTKMEKLQVWEAQRKSVFKTRHKCLPMGKYYPGKNPPLSFSKYISIIRVFRENKGYRFFTHTPENKGCLPPKLSTNAFSEPKPS